MRLYSPAFEEMGAIPRRHTGFGEDLSPELRLEDIPPRAVSLAVTLDDPDIPLRGELTHWVIRNIPPRAVIPEGLPKGRRLETPIAAVQGRTWGRYRYRGPKQSPFVHRAHRYRFTTYALDIMPDLPASAGKAALLKAARGHILAEASLTGVFDPNTL